MVLGNEDEVFLSPQARTQRKRQVQSNCRLIRPSLMMLAHLMKVFANLDEW
jgi:hypothetical protein